MRAFFGSDFVKDGSIRVATPQPCSSLDNITTGPVGPICAQIREQWQPLDPTGTQTRSVYFCYANSTKCSHYPFQIFK